MEKLGLTKQLTDLFCQRIDLLSQIIAFWFISLFDMICFTAMALAKMEAGSFFIKINSKSRVKERHLKLSEDHLSILFDKTKGTCRKRVVVSTSKFPTASVWWHIRATPIFYQIILMLALPIITSKWFGKISMWPLYTTIHMLSFTQSNHVMIKKDAHRMVS